LGLAGLIGCEFAELGKNLIARLFRDGSDSCCACSRLFSMSTEKMMMRKEQLDRMRVFIIKFKAFQKINVYSDMDTLPKVTVFLNGV
jgi:hypothetical protein